NRESVQGHLLVGFPCMGIQARVVWQGLNGLLAGSFASEWGTRRERTPLIVPQRSKEKANGVQRGGCRSGSEESAGTVERRRGNRNGGARRAGPRRHSFLSTAKRLSSRGLGSLTLGPEHRSLQVDPVRVMGPGAIRVGSQAAGLLGP